MKCFSVDTFGRWVAAEIGTDAGSRMPADVIRFASILNDMAEYMSHPSLTSLVELLGARAAERSQGRYVFQSDAIANREELTLVELDQRARCLAGWLQEQGLAGQTVVLCFPPGLEFLVGLFGCLYANVIAVPADVPRIRRSACRLKSIAEDCGAATALTTTLVAEKIRSWDDPFLSNMQWINAAGVAGESPQEAWQAPTIAPDDVAILQYTSGSTGDPKGVMLTHRCILHNIQRMAEVLGLYKGVRAVTWLPAFHDMGLIGNLLQTPFMECDMVVMPPVDFVKNPLSWLRNITEHQAFVSGGPNFALNMCIKKAKEAAPEELAALDLSFWEVMYIGAEPISPTTLDQFAEVFGRYGFRRTTYFPCYGLAEATLMVSGGPHHAGANVYQVDPGALEQNQVAAVHGTGKTLVGCGKIIPDMEVVVVDPETGQPCPPQAIGEIWVAGPSVSAGYWRKPDDVAQTFNGRIAGRDQTYLRTGDLGYLSGDELIVTGRIKELMIIRGANYYPQDLEEAVRNETPDLRDYQTAVFLSQDGDESVVAVQETPRDSRDWKAIDVLNKARKAIAERFELELRTLVLVRSNTLPKSSSGKLRRGEVKRRYYKGELSIIDECSFAPKKPHPHTTFGEAVPAQKNQSLPQIQNWLIERIANQIGVSATEIDLHRPFAEYGLDSTTMVRIAWEFEQWLGRELPPTLLYEAPTIAALCHEVSNPEKDTTPANDSLAPIANEPIAVVGMGCRFPGADSPQAFWNLLVEGVDAVRALPDGRWPDDAVDLTIRQGGFLDGVDLFDPDFFGVSPREADWMDPQHRLLLETAIEALEYGGIAPASLQHKSTGVFVGISANDYSRLIMRHERQRDAYTNTGNAQSMAAHRLSYHLDLRGPSIAIDTACSSSLAALHLACQSLRAGDCEMALAGGVNLILTPDVSESLAAMQMLSPDGACKTFDASADGYVRGEGCGIVVLKPLSAAERDGDMILAVIDGSAMNQDGRSNGITAPNGKAQTQLIQRALRNAGRSAAEITFVETHGTGTALGDPIEFDALAAALGTGAARCVLGAVKTNIGHLESAAGIAGFIKTVLQIQHRQIAPLVHFREPNEGLRWKNSRFRFARRLQSWKSTNRPLVAGVSSFGFGGTNVHIILSEAPPSNRGVAPTQTAKPFLLPLSAQHPDALADLANRYRDVLREAPHRLEDVCRTAGAGRAHRHYRLTAVTKTAEEMAHALTAFADGNPDPRIHTGIVQSRLSEQTSWVFTGQGSFHPGAALRLAECCPAFREELHRCEDVLREFFPVPVLDLLGGRDERFPLQRTDVAQPLTLALQVALARTLSGFGLQPAALLGHSVGELAAVVAAGGMTLADGIRLAVERGRAMQDECRQGAMLACFANTDSVRSALGEPSPLTIAVINGAENTVLSGSIEDIANAELRLGNHGMDTRRLRVDRAFHSPLIEPALDRLRFAAKSTQCAPLQIPVISNVSGAFHEEPITAEYWVQHARSAVQFATGLDTLNETGITHFVEIGPDAVLCRLGQSHAATAKSCWLPTLQRDRDDWETMLQCLSRLYVDGASLQWNEIYRGCAGSRIVLPTYPFRHRRCWIDGDLREDAGSWIPKSCLQQEIPRPKITDVTPHRLVEQLTTPISDLRHSHRLDRFDDLVKAFGRLTTRYILDVFSQLGWEFEKNEKVVFEPLVKRLQVVPQYRRLMRRLLSILAEDGVLKETDSGWRVCETPELDEANATHQRLLDEFPSFATELRLAHRCAKHMAGVMRGDVDPLHVLFGEEGAELTERLYERSPFAQFYNQLTAKAVEQTAAILPANRTLRILEVGAGTGGTTAHVLPRLDGNRCEYVFSDVSSLFLHRAEEKFHKHSFVEYELLDLEVDASDIPFAAEQFDLILAANVIHATKDVRGALRCIHRLLAPGGLMLLLEGTKPLRLLDLIFGLTDGWWRFEDRELRKHHPLLSVDQWRRVLQQEGFSNTAVLPGDDADASGQFVFAAQRGDDVHRNGKHESNGKTSSSTIIFRNGSGHAESLMGLWTRNGQRVIAAEAGDRFHLSQNICWLRPTEMDDWRALLDGAQSSQHDATAHIVYWWNAEKERIPSADLAKLAQERDTALTVVSCGRIDLDSTSFQSPFDAKSIRWIDLDPEDSAAVQYACLAESVRHPDDQVIVAFRGGQRFVPRRLPAKRSHAPTESKTILDKNAILAADPENRPAILEQHLRTEFARITGVHLSSEDVDRPLNSFGLDSLMAIQLRNRVEADLQVSLSLVDFLKGLSLQQIVSNAVQQLNGLSHPADPVSPKPSLNDESVAASNVEQLSEGELDSLLQSFLQQGD